MLPSGKKSPTILFYSIDPELSIEQTILNLLLLTTELGIYSSISGGILEKQLVVKLILCLYLGSFFKDHLLLPLLARHPLV